MPDTKVSVVVPVFNAEKYLDKCLRSIVSQNLKEIEVIVVNDGSTDSTDEIIQRHAKSDFRIVQVNTANSGVSAARNTGLRRATGTYIAFADADDWLESEMLATMYSRAIEEGADMVICNVNMWTGNNDPSIRLSLKTVTKDAETNRAQEVGDLMDFKYDYANWNKLYKREIILNYHLMFDEKMKVWEDLLFNLTFLHHTKRFSVIEHAFYNYRLHPESIMAVEQHDFISEYNSLFEGYQFFSRDHATSDIFNIFRLKASRALYYNLIPRIVSKAIKTSQRRRDFVQKITSDLKRFNKAIFCFDDAQLKGWQGLKKHLLIKGNFSLFAQLVGLKFHNLKQSQKQNLDIS